MFLKRIYVVFSKVQCRRERLDTVQAEVGISNQILSISCPAFEPIRYPMSDAPVTSISEECLVGHPFHRPFDKFLEEGKPEIGLVRYLLLKVGISPFPAVLGAVAYSRSVGVQKAWSGRTIFFPGWGDGQVDLGDSKGRQIEQKSPIHHISLDLKGKNKGSIHMTAPSTKPPKKIRVWDATALGLGDKTALHVGTLLVQRPDKLDPSGICQKKLGKLPRANSSEVERTIQF